MSSWALRLQILCAPELFLWAFTFSRDPPPPPFFPLLRPTPLLPFVYNPPGRLRLVLGLGARPRLWFYFMSVGRALLSVTRIQRPLEVSYFLFMRISCASRAAAQWRVQANLPLAQLTSPANSLREIGGASVRKISAACKLCTARRRVPLNKEPDKPYKGQTNKGRLFFFPPPHH